VGRANPGKIRGEFVGDALAVLPDTVRALGAALLLFGVCGFGIVRLALPAGLRAAEALWVLPVGAAASALALTVLGFAAVPFGVSLVVVLAAGATVVSAASATDVVVASTATVPVTRAPEVVPAGGNRPSVTTEAQTRAATATPSPTSQLLDRSRGAATAQRHYGRLA